MSFLFLIIAVLVLAFANGANDNFKGVATLYGTATTTYRQSLIWATVTTFSGSVIALFLGRSLAASFSGKGLVADALLLNPTFGISVALGAALTVLIATKCGLPISTTHAIVGSLLGSGLSQAAGEVNFTKLATVFLAPLLLSPLISALLVLLIYPLSSRLRSKLDIREETCLCVGKEVICIAPAGATPEEAMSLLNIIAIPKVFAGETATCKKRYQGEVIGINAHQLLNFSHFLSAGMLGLARGLNDTPKILGILLLTSALSPDLGIILIAIVMAVGGIIGARQVAETMSHRISEMNDGQGLVANSISSALVLCSTFFGLPVSTTHVSCGAIFGIGMINKTARWKIISTILLAWFITLPTAIIISWTTFKVFS